MPKVSVLTPVFNTKKEYLKEMIESILTQSFKDFEFLILNDSPDNKELKKIICSYKDERIKYTENEFNIGISQSRNKLLDMAQGEYIAIFDHDDISLPFRLEKEVDFLDSHKNYGVVSSNFIKKSDKKISKNPETNAEIKKELVVRGCIVTHSASMIRKSLLTENNIKWEKEFSPCEDYMLFSRLIDKTMFYNIQEPLIIYRNHCDNTTHNQYKEMEDRESLIKNLLAKKYPYFYNLSCKRSYIYLFGFIPLIKVQKKGNKCKYLLFGIIPLLKIVK